MREMVKISASSSLNSVKSIKSQVEPISLLEESKDPMKSPNRLQLGLLPKSNNNHHLLPSAKSLFRSNQTMAKKLLTSVTKLRVATTLTKKTWFQAVPSIRTDQRNRWVLWAIALWGIRLTKEGTEGEEKDEFNLVIIEYLHLK